MKILMVYENPLRGLVNIDSRVQRESESLAKANHDVSFFLLFHYNDVTKVIKRFGTKNITILGAAKQTPKCPGNIGFIRKVVWQFIISSKFEKMLSLIQRFFHRFKLGFLIPYDGFESLKTLLSIPTDVYHAHDYSTLKFTRFCAWFNKKPFVYDSHEFWSGMGSARLRKIRRFYESFHLSKAYAIISVSYEISKILTKIYRSPKHVVVRNFPVYRKLTKNRKLREKIGVSDSVPIVIYVGAFIPGRGIEQLITVAKYLPNIKFIFLGFGMLKEKIIQESKKENLKNIEVLDPVPSNEVIEWISSADIGVFGCEKIHLSYYLSLPNKIGEYIMAGIPIAVSDFPEMRKPVINDDVGVVFNPDDPKDIVKAIRELLVPEIYTIKKQNVLRARQTYSWESEEKKLITIYDRISKEY